MKENNTMNSIDQYLLERYPIIWNTRILWMLIGGIVIHSLFFFWGYINVTGPPVGRHGYEDISFALPDTAGVTMFSVAISVVLLVFWTTQLLKNNGFKHFYPTRSTDLVQYFVSYLLIIFVCTTFYLSYLKGFTAQAKELWQLNVHQTLIWNNSIDLSFYVGLWTAFCLSSWLFIFRITDIRSSLLTAVSIGLIGILIGLFTLFIGISGTSIEFGVPYFILFIYLVILILPHLAGEQMSKRAQAICMNISILMSVPMLLLIFTIITLHQEDGRSPHRRSLIEALGSGTHWILLLWGILFVFLYSYRVRAWKSLPEG